MSAHCTCAGSRSRLSHFAGWALPAAGLALIPKCPMCLAAYLAIATGVALPLPAAAWLRILLLALCAGALLFLAARWIRGVLSIRPLLNRRSFEVGECRHP